MQCVQFAVGGCNKGSEPIICKHGNEFFQIVIPWLWRIVKFTAKTVVIAFFSWAISIPSVVRRIAAEWSHRAMVAGVPSEYDQWLYYGSMAIAIVLVVLGWVISAYITVWIVGRIF